MSEKLARSFACWHDNFKGWHAVWYIGMFISTLACKNEKLARFWHVGTQTGWHVNHAGIQAHWHINQVGTQARWHADHIGMQSRMTRNLGNSKDPIETCFSKKFILDLSIYPTFCF